MTRILAGRRSVLEALRGNPSIRRIYVEPQRVDEELEGAAQARDLLLTHGDRNELDRLSEGLRHQGVVAIAEDYPFCDLDDLLVDRSRPLALVALDQITDPQNFGAIIRSAVTLGFDGTIIQKHRAAGITPAVVRASAGATEHAAIARVTNLQKTLLSLGQAGLEIIGLDGLARPLARRFGPCPRRRLGRQGAPSHGPRTL